MELKNIFEYIIAKEIEDNLLVKTRKSRELKASDLKPCSKEFKVNVTLDAAKRKMQVEIIDGDVIIYKDWLQSNGLFTNAYEVESVAYNLRKMKQKYTIKSRANKDYEDEDYEDEDYEDEEE